jgi:predicted DNA-binding transcriptional regulator AlpA
MNSLPPDDVLLGPKDVARILDIDLRTLRRWLAAGRFPKPSRIGKRYRRWLSQDIRALLEDKKEQPCTTGCTA